MEALKSESTRLSGKRPRVSADAIREFPSSCRTFQNSYLEVNEGEEVRVLSDKSNHSCSMGASALPSKLMRDRDLAVMPHDDAGVDVAEKSLRISAKCRKVENVPGFASINKLRVKEAVKMFHQIYGEVKRELEQAKPLTLSCLLEHEERFNSQADGPFMEAAKRMMERNMWVNRRKRVGSVPGVEVGDEFCCRTEMAVTGVHCQYRCGIDFLSKDEGHLAVSVVESGRYANDVRSVDEMIYCGGGGNPRVWTSSGDDEDQKLKRGNIALLNSMKLKSPVRVIRKYKLPKDVHGFLGTDHERLCDFKYVYEGSFYVSEFWEERAISGKKIFRFRLIRAAPKLVHHGNALAMPLAVNSKALKGVPHPERALATAATDNSRALKKQVCVDDISSGRERMPIRALNKYDDEKPPPFNYLAAMIYPGKLELSPPRGCQCVGECNPKTCSCAMKNGGRIPYDRDGRLHKFEPLIYECGPFCKCRSSCTNRVSQHGIKFELELFKTPSKRWHVRARPHIPVGSFVCEYIGEVLPRGLVERGAGRDDYLFDVEGDCSSRMDDRRRFTIDASKFGNIGRFINRSDRPNLRAQYVLYDHNDRRMPHIMFFASKDIPPSTELTR